jgi:hypothetical protein
MSGFTHERGYEGATNIWLTPKHVIDALGSFDLDPCAAPEPRPWSTAQRHIVEDEDGLSKPWDGFCWVNPPYGPNTGTWLGKLASHSGGGIALIFARTETKAFFDNVWSKADAIYFIQGRLKFCRPDGKAGESAAAPSVLIGYGPEAVKRLAAIGDKVPGHFIINPKRDLA